MRRKVFRLLLASPVLFLRTVIYSANAALQVIDQLKYEIDSILSGSEPVPMRSASEAFAKPVDQQGDIDDRSPFIMN